MGMDDKINMALSGNREERMALAMDSNRAIHHYLLKNAKDRQEKIALINYHLYQIRTTFFRQTMFAEFELLIHKLVENNMPFYDGRTVYIFN